MRRLALVAVGELDEDGPRLARLGPAAVIAPPEHAAALGCSATWFEGDLTAPAPALSPGLRALRALESLGGDFDEIHCTPEGAWAIASAARTGGLGKGRVVVEVRAAHARLLRRAAVGERWGDILFREALLHGLRDADAVLGDASALEALRAAVPVAVPREPPAWDETSAPAVTAVVTHKDLQRFLPACLESLRAQTVPVEILVVDDGSGPAGLEALAAEERKDPALRVFRRLHEGLSGARNFGVGAARTELVLIVDADNLLRPNLVERLREALRLSPSAAVATCGFRAFEDSTGATLYRYSPAELSPRTLFFANTGGDACALHRRASLLTAGGYERDDEFCEDWDLWLRYADRGMTSAPVREPLFDYRVRPDSKLRTHSLISQAAMHFKLLLLHPRLAAGNARELAVLAASELAGLQEAALTRAAQAHTAKALAASQAERAAAAAAQAELSALRAERAEAAGQVAESARAVAEREREAALQELRAARRDLQRLQEQLLDMSSSSAVRLAQALRESSPAAHAAVAWALRFALTLKRR